MKSAPINDYESMMIGLQMKEISNDPKSSKLLNLISINIVCNLYSSVIVNPKGRLKGLYKAIDNDREGRTRPPMTEKKTDLAFVLKKDDGEEKEDFADDIGHYGKKWGEVVYQYELASPSFSEMMKGLFEWYHGQMTADMKNKSK